MFLGLKIKFDNLSKNLKSLPFPVSGAPQRSSLWISKKYCYSFNNNDGRCERGQNCKYPHVCESVAGVIFRDCADNHIKERVNQSLTTDQRTTMSPIKNAFRIPTMGSVLF